MSCVFRLFPSRMKEITVFLASFRAARTIIPSFLRHSFLRGVSDSVSCSPHFFAISMYCVSKSVSDSILSKKTVARLQNEMDGGKMQHFQHFPHTSLTIVFRNLLSLHHRFCEPDAQSVRLADETLLLTKDATTSLSSSSKTSQLFSIEDNATLEVSALVDCISTSTPVWVGSWIMHISRAWAFLSLLIQCKGNAKASKDG